MVKSVIIWANCQGGSIGQMLQKYYSDIFTVKYYANYEYMQNKMDLPDCFTTCDIFLYQNYSNNEEQYCIQNILDNILSPTSIKIAFPTLHRNHLQFCYNIDSPENMQTISALFPHGYFFYGIQPIRKMVLQLKNEGMNVEDVIAKTLETINRSDFITDEQIEYHENLSLEFLKTKALTSDIPNIYNFIEAHYKRIRLWHNPNHPNGILLNALCKEIFTKLGLTYPDENGAILFLETTLKDWKMPIFRAICTKYNIENIDNECSSVWHDDIFDEISYVHKYVKFLYMCA